MGRCATARNGRSPQRIEVAYIAKYNTVSFLTACLTLLGLPPYEMINVAPRIVGLQRLQSLNTIHY